MSFGTIDVVSMTRLQDMSVIKHNEDNKGAVQQAHLTQEAQKESQLKPKEVRRGDETAWQQKKHDAKEKGGSEYQASQQKRKKNPKPVPGTVVVNGHRGFDIKI